LSKILGRYYPDNQTTTNNLLEKIHGTLRRLERIAPAKEKTGLDSLAEILRRFFEEQTVNTGKPEHGICCAKLMDIRGLYFDALILLGLIDGEFPASRSENALFRNDLRREINQQAGENLFTATGADLQRMENFTLFPSQPRDPTSFDHLPGKRQSRARSASLTIRNRNMVLSVKH